MKVAITGATGHLGGVIVRELNHRQHLVKALTRTADPIGFEEIPVEWIIGDLQDKEALSKMMDSCDTVIHSAGLISIDGDQGGLVPLVNIEGTRNIMEAAKSTGIKRVVHISSIQAYQQTPSNEILDESRPKTSDHSFAYDRSKRDGENIALSYASDHMEVIVVNPTSIVGPYDFKPSKLGHAIIQMGKGQMPFVLKGGTDYCDVRDLAHAIVNALSMGKSGESYLLSGKWYSLKELARMVGHVRSEEINPTALPTVFAWMGLPFTALTAWIKKEEPLITREAIVAVTEGNRKISSEKAQRELQYNPRPLEETIRDVCDWFKKNGYLE
jgi:dihydroflavonol-4-reductase